MRQHHPEAIQTTLEMRLMWPSGGRFHEPTAILDIMDVPSRRVIVSVELSPNQFTALMAGRGIEPAATLLPAKFYQDVGKTWEVLVWREPEMRASIAEGDLPEEFLRYHDPLKWKPGHDRAQPSVQMQQWADAHAKVLGYTEAQWSEHNWGWGVRFSRYADTPAADA